jgi:hypothetical protein
VECTELGGVYQLMAWWPVVQVVSLQTKQTNQTIHAWGSTVCAFQVASAWGFICGFGMLWP